MFHHNYYLSINFSFTVSWLLSIQINVYYVSFLIRYGDLLESYYTS